MTVVVRRLVHSFVPEHYNLTLDLDKKAMSFKGTVSIQGQKIGRPAKRLVFHQKDLKITSASLTHLGKQSTEIPVTRINNHDKFDEVRLHTEKLLYSGHYEVNMQFEGAVTKPMNGIYPCFYREGDKEEVMLATQFESHHAREAFPCIDEPEAKATFNLKLITEKEEAIVANTPVLHRKSLGDREETQFETTPKMSSYLLAFAVGKMHYREKITKDGVRVRAYARPDLVKFTNFALDTAVKCLEYFNDYFGIAYPLPKCDLIALPDFAAGAMENWGCVTFREQSLMYDPANTSLSMKQYVGMVVAHELAHQWFGNLVTMRWWNDLWLNEGFASWIEHLATDYLFPEWQMWTQFRVDETGPALTLDALENTHPIEVAIHHPDEIRTIFDSISYSKGSSAINMLYNYLGADDFREGLRRYLKKHSYGNAETNDLWAALESVSHKPVSDFMHKWVAKPGFPLLNAEVGNQSVLLSQSRFYMNPKLQHTPSEDEIWPVPLLAGANLPELFDKAQTTLTVDTGFIKVNIGQTGFYRTIYNAEHLETLGDLVREKMLSPLDRLGILSDAVESSKAGYLPTVEALELLKNYAEEDNSAVWDVIAGNIVSIRNVMMDESLRDSMKSTVRELTSIQRARLGWEAKSSDDYFDKLLRPTILGLAASADEPSVITKINETFSKLKNPETVDPDLRGVVYMTVARLGDEKDFKKILEIYKKTESSDNRVTLAAALTNFRQENLIDEALSLMMTDLVRLQDIAYWIGYSFANRFAKKQTWKWMTTHWRWLIDNLGSDLSFSRFPIYAAQSNSSKEFLDEYKTFFHKVNTPAIDRAVKQGQEIIEWQSAWRERDLKGLKNYFKQKP